MIMLMHQWMMHTDDGHQAEPMSRRHGSIPMNQVDPSLLVTGFKNIFQKYLKQKEAESSKGVESNIEASISGLQGDHFQTDSTKGFKQVCIQQYW